MNYDFRPGDDDTEQLEDSEMDQNLPLDTSDGELKHTIDTEAVADTGDDVSYPDGEDPSAFADDTEVTA